MRWLPTAVDFCWRAPVGGAESGSVRVGGQDVGSTQLSSLRGAMGQVPQVGAARHGTTCRQLLGA